MTEPSESPFPVWQGFRHSWTYNHRLNRIGNWLETTTRDGDAVEVEFGHSAASGTGRDEATFRGFHTIVRAAGVHYREFGRTISIQSKEEKTQSFVCEIRVTEDDIPEDCDTFAAVLCGFDLMSEKDADKLSSFHLATSRPWRDGVTGDVVFEIMGALNVDCDSPECDSHSTTGGMIASVAAGAVLGFNYGVPGAIAGALFGALFTKLGLKTDYTLDVRAALVTARSDRLHVTPDVGLNTFDWDKKDVITRVNDGTLRSFEMIGDNGAHWTSSVPAITQLSLEVTRKRGLLRPDTAMHLLELDAAVRPTEASGNQCRADLELFFRNWQVEDSKYLDEQVGFFDAIEPLDDLSESLASHRDAGSATMVIGLTLLQFAAANVMDQDSWHDSLVWEAQGASAKSGEATRRKTGGPYVVADPAEALCEPSEDVNSLRIAAEHSN